MPARKRALSPGSGPEQPPTGKRQKGDVELTNDTGEPLPKTPSMDGEEDVGQGLPKPKRKSQAKRQARLRHFQSKTDQQRFGMVTLPSPTESHFLAFWTRIWPFFPELSCEKREHTRLPWRSHHLSKNLLTTILEHRYSAPLTEYAADSAKTSLEMSRMWSFAFSSYSSEGRVAGWLHHHSVGGSPLCGGKGWWVWR